MVGLEIGLEVGRQQICGLDVGCPHTCRGFDVGFFYVGGFAVGGVAVGFAGVDACARG